MNYLRRRKISLIIRGVSATTFVVAPFALLATHGNTMSDVQDIFNLDLDDKANINIKENSLYNSQGSVVVSGSYFNNKKLVLNYSLKTYGSQIYVPKTYEEIMGLNKLNNKDIIRITVERKTNDFRFQKNAIITKLFEIKSLMLTPNDEKLEVADSLIAIEDVYTTSHLHRSAAYVFNDTTITKGGFEEYEKFIGIDMADFEIPEFTLHEIEYISTSNNIPDNQDYLDIKLTLSKHGASFSKTFKVIGFSKIIRNIFEDVHISSVRDVVSFERKTDGMTVKIDPIKSISNRLNFAMYDPVTKLVVNEITGIQLNEGYVVLVSAKDGFVFASKNDNGEVWAAQSTNVITEYP